MDITPFYRQLRKSVYTIGHGKEELKARPNLPNKAQLLAMFQAMEDATVAHFTSTIKPAIDTALGNNINLAAAQKLYAGYLTWKIENILGG